MYPDAARRLRPQGRAAAASGKATKTREVRERAQDSLCVQLCSCRRSPADGGQHHLGNVSDGRRSRVMTSLRPSTDLRRFDTELILDER